MKLEIKQREETPELKKILIYGEDGTGKSTFAKLYCEKHNLKPICIDIDDTNWSGVEYVTINQKGDMSTYTSLKNTITAITNTNEYDTIIYDGTSSSFELLTSTAKGLKKYADRSERFYTLLRQLLTSNKHIIFIGQIDMKVIYNEDCQSPKPIIKLNSLVNEKYLTIREGDKFSIVCEKNRGNNNIKEGDKINITTEL